VPYETILADEQGLGHGRLQVGMGLANRLRELQAAGQQCGYGGGERAAAAVGIEARPALTFKRPV